MSKQTRDDILRRIQSLRTMAQDERTPANERLTALGLLRALQQKYNITDDDVAKAKKSEIIHAQIMLPFPTRLLWSGFITTTIAAFYDTQCLLLRNDSLGPMLYGFVIAGEALDVEIAATVIDMVLPQALEQGEMFYNWAAQVHQNKSEKSSTSFQTYITTQSSSTAWIQMLFVAADSMDMLVENEVRRLLRGYEQMPERESEAWREIENDWGMGLNAAINYRLRTLAEQSARAEGLDRHNALVRTSNALAINSEEISRRKIGNAVAHIQGQMKGDLKREVRDSPKNPIIFEEGVRAGQDGVRIDAEVVKKGNG